MFFVYHNFLVDYELLFFEHMKISIKTYDKKNVYG